MAIPEAQLDTWSHQGSITQSSTTYNTIKDVLESSKSPYVSREFGVFLQGSYGNDTNIYSESDVDIVIRLDSCFYPNLDDLSDAEKVAYKKAYSGNADYAYDDFKKDVLAHLKKEYGDYAKPGNKAVEIKANGSRRKADVIISAQYRRYYKFSSIYNSSYHSGICFYNAAGTQIANYPKQHSENCTAKHQGTSAYFKPMVRILKNMRSKLIEKKMIDEGSAPSYYLEGLLYNVPKEKFGTSYGTSFVNALNWMLQADRSTFECANERYYLLREGSPVTWRDAQCTAFLSAVAKLWNQW